MFYNNRTVMFDIIHNHEEGYAPQVQRIFYVRTDRFVVPGEAGCVAVAQESLERRDVVDESMC